MSCRTNCCKTLLLVTVLLAMAVVAAPAFAQGGPPNSPPNNCLLNEYQLGQGLSPACPAKDPLQCTANDVAISQVPAGDIIILGGGLNNPPRCFQGVNFQFIAVFDIVTTSNSSTPGGRDNVGLYFAQPGNPNPFPKETKIGPVSAECGAAGTQGCIDNIIAPLHGGFTCPTGTTCPGQFGSDNYHELDNGGAAGPDTCGDTTAGDFSPALPGGWGFGTSSEGVAIQIGDPNVSTSGFQCPATSTTLNTCTAANGTTGILMPYCTSWQTPGNTALCVMGSGDSYSSAAVPGTPSKCNCTTTCLPIQPISITVLAAKACTTKLTTGSTNTPPGRVYSFSGTPLAGNGNPNDCDEGIDGVDAPTYGVAMDFSASIGGVILDQICDDVYGTVASAFSPSTCPVAGSIPAANTTCGGEIGKTFTTSPTGEICTFTVPSLGVENAQKTDHVTVYVHSSQPGVSTTATSPASNPVTVFSDEANSTATAVKSVVGPVNACVTVRYQVAVTNNSGSDETEFMSTLTDTVTGGSAQDLTKLGSGTALGTVLGTTCNAQCSGAACTNGLGTLSGSLNVPFPPAGLSPSNGMYTCQFDMQFCNTAALDVNGCFTTPTDRATAGLTGDTTGGETAASVTATSNLISANVCITAK